MPPKNGDQPATKADIQALESRFDSVEKKLDSKIDSVEKKLDSKIDSVEKRLDSKIDSVEKKLDSKIDSVEKKLDSKIDSSVDRLSLEIAKTNAAVARSERRTAERLEAVESRLLRAIESFVGKAQDHGRTLLVYDRILKDHRLTLSAHEKRLASLESKR